jgi:hypothetical protein
MSPWTAKRGIKMAFGNFCSESDISIVSVCLWIPEPSPKSTDSQCAV